MSLPTISTINNGESAGVIRQKLNENFASILSALGDRGLSWSGSYDNATQYQKGNVVYYGSALYIAKNDVIGLIPTNTSAWDFLLDGPQGIPGADGAGAGDMLKSDNLSGLADYAVARSNMGLGSLATQSGTFSDKEDVANKSTSVTTDQASNTKYPSVKSVYDWGIATFAKYLGDADFYKYSIVTSVASGNLTVALKNYEGNDPTPTKPVKIQIGGVIRTITSACYINVTIAGTNWGNTGSAELATKEIDWFVYILDYNNSGAGFNLGISRYPLYNNLSEATGGYTSEKYLIQSGNIGIENVVNIGRFNATLSAGGAYTWSIPATSVIINSKILENQKQKNQLIVGEGINQSASYTTSVTMDFSSFIEYDITAQAGALLFNNPSGTPVNGQKRMVRIKDNGTARALTYGTQFASGSGTLLPTTVISKKSWMGFEWDSTDSKYYCIASGTQP